MSAAFRLGWSIAPLLNIDFSYDSNLDGLDERVKAAIAKKLTMLTTIMHNKVVENITGKILQQKTGQLLSSIQQRVDTSSNPMMGEVFVEPTSAKAWALEKGGEREYQILPTKSAVLRFYWDKVGQVVNFYSVNHPPSREFAYLKTALMEMETLVAEGLQSAIDEALEGG